MINQPVIVTANKEGHIINETSNPDWYRFRVEQAFPTMSGGILSMRKRSALISINEKEIDVIEPMLVAGKPYFMQGKIVVTEQTVPFWENQSPKINPQTNEILLFDGQPIFRNTEFVPDSMGIDAQQDTFCLLYTSPSPRDLH